MRSSFNYPTFQSMGISDSQDEVTYFCGNSLGLMPKDTKILVNKELDAWASRGVVAHHTRSDGKDPWVFNNASIEKRLANLIFGCLESEIAYTSTLTSNLNALLQAFYKPTSSRYKIICEHKPFPSDIYSFQNQIKMHNLDVSDALVTISPKNGRDYLLTEEILEVINEHGSETAIVLLPAIQFYSGQFFDMQTITKATKSVGAISGWDLAHASGNVPLKLHDWNVDFAVFCSYKYLNSGPGNLGGLFVHSDFQLASKSNPRPAGWWGVNVNKRFDMDFDFEADEGARGFAQSNVCLFGPPCMHASLDLFEAAGGMDSLRAQSIQLTTKLEQLLKQSKHYGKLFRIMTDGLPLEQRGCQLSIAFEGNLMDKVNDELVKRGVIGDERKPSVIRLAPVPLYNTMEEVEYAGRVFNEVLDTIIRTQ